MTMLPVNIDFLTPKLILINTAMARLETFFFYSAYNPPPPPPQKKKKKKKTSVYKPIQNPLQSCLSPGLIARILRYLLTV